MDKYPKIALLVFSIILLGFSCGFSQSQEYKFRHLTTKDGLPSNSINAIITDSKGFMWFATDNGLARYDGYNIQVYYLPEDSVSSVDIQVINDIIEDTDGNLWIGTQEQGLLLFDRISETFTGFINPRDDTLDLGNFPVNTIYQDGEGIIWIGTNGGGLNCLDLDHDRISVFKQVPEDSQNLNNNITAILEDKTGILWVGTHDGVFLFDKNNRNFTKVKLPAEIPTGIWSIVNCIIEDKNSQIWIGTYWGLFRYHPETEQITQVSEQLNLSQGVITSIIEDTLQEEHGFWIATQFGLYRLYTRDGKVQKFYQDHNEPASLSSDIISELFLDDYRQLWIGTYTKGVNILNTSTIPFHHYEVINFKSDIIWQPISFCVDVNNELWVGAFDGGLFHYDSTFELVSNYDLWEFDPAHYDRRHNDRISCILEESNTTLLLGFYEWGLIRFHKEDETFKQVLMIPALESPVKIDHIVRDRNGILWVGTNQGLYAGKYGDDNSALQVIDHSLMSRAEILSIYIDKQSQLWVSTRENGCFLIKRDRSENINESAAFQSVGSFFGEYIHTFYEDNDNILWVGTNKGLNKYNSEDQQFETVGFFNDIYGGEIIKIFGDDQENLWIFHATHGLLRFNKTSEVNNVKKFDVTDGLPFDQFNSKYFNTNSFYQSPDGRLFMGCDVGSREGFFWFHPGSIKDNEQPPEVVVTDFQVGNEGFILDSSINYKQHITLDYDENFFSFEFAALNLFIPEKNQYAYYLDGYEDDWIYSDNRRFANYTGVPPGEYTFHVKGSNNDGYWNEEGTSLRITITPPFWKTWWAYIVYGIVILLIFYSIIYYYLRRQRLLDKLALEKVESEKLKELDGLKTRFFTNISHEFRTPLTLILGPVQQLLAKIANPADRQNLSIIQQNALRLNELINQLLSLSKLESGKMVLHATEVDLVQFVWNCMQSFESLAGHKKIELSFSSDQENLIAFIDKEKMTQVMNNMLSNAFKFTPAGGRIVVGITRQKSSVVNRQSSDKNFTSAKDCRLKTEDLPADCTVISISDTGSGIPPDHLAHIFDRFYQADDSISREQEGTGIGLAIAQEMVKLHHGEIAVESEVGSGTTFYILLPIGSKHLDTSRQSSVVSRQQSDLTPFAPQPPEGVENGRLSVVSFQPSKNDNAELTFDSFRSPLGDLEVENPILLIVEDNPDMRAFIRGYFEQEYQVMEAENGEEGLKMAIEQIPDIVVSDVMMPRMDGYEFCHKLKTDDRTCHIPVILLTARATKESRLEGLETGADDFITKPFDGEELQVRVKNLVDQRRRLSEHYQRRFELVDEKGSEVILSMDEKFLEKAQDLIEENVSNADYGVESFANDMALSRVQLHRKLRALVDQSATEFIRTIRLKHAIKLLRNKTGTIAEIAYDSGFNNPTYFSISFKKRYGISPSEYLEQPGKK